MKIKNAIFCQQKFCPYALHHLFFSILILIYFIQPVDSSAKWVESNQPPPGFKNLSVGERVSVFFEGDKVGVAEIKVVDHYMTILQMSPLNLKQQGLLPQYEEEVSLYLKQPKIMINEDYISKDPKLRDLTYKDIKKAVLPKKVKVVLNQNNLHLYIFVNPQWVDTRQKFSPSYLGVPTAGWSYFVDNNVTYNAFNSQFEANKSLNFNQLYGLSLGKTFLQGNFSAYYTDTGERTLNLNNIYGNTYHNGHYYSFGMLSFPSLQGVYLPPMLGVLGGTDMNTLRTNNLQGTPIILSISSPSHVLIRNTKNDRYIYSKLLYPGVQQVDTSSFVSGVYPIEIQITDFTGKKKYITRLFIKNPNIPILGYPQYQYGAGFLLAEKQSSIGSIQIPEYDFKKPAVFFSMNRALSYRSAFTLGLLHTKENTFGNLIGTLYGENYLATLNSLITLHASLGVKLTYDYFLNNDEKYPFFFHLNGEKTWAGKDNYFTNNYSMSANMVYEFPIADWKISTLLGFDCRKLEQTDISYEASLSRTLFFSFNDFSNFSMNLTMGFNAVQKAFTLLSFAYNYFYGDNQINFNVDGSNNSLYSPDQSRGFMFSPSVAGQTKLLNNRLYISGMANYDQGVHKNLAMHYNGNMLESNVNFSKSPFANMVFGQTDFGITGTSSGVSFANLSSRDITGVILDVTADKSIKYNVLVNDQIVSDGVANKKQFINLAPFNQYLIEIVPQSVSYLNKKKNIIVTLYEGNIQNIKIHLIREIIVITRLIDINQKAIKDAWLTDIDGNTLVTNKNGYIQFSVLQNQKEVIFTLSDKKKCKIVFPNFEEKVFFYSKKTICQPL